MLWDFICYSARPELRVMSIHPATAKELGIQEGDDVMVETPRGKMDAKAYLTEGIHPKVVQLPSHWVDHHNVNVVMDNEHCAPYIGSAQLRCQLCRVKRKESLNSRAD